MRLSAALGSEMARLVLVPSASSLPEHLHNNPRQAKERPDEVKQPCDVHRQPPPAILGGAARAPGQPSEKHDSKGHRDDTKGRVQCVILQHHVGRAAKQNMAPANRLVHAFRPFSIKHLANAPPI